MKHLGDITKIDGAKIEPVDIITFGSPCQDLSVAGGRAGLAGERSGLFMEAVRIIKEMRNATKQLSMRGADDNIRVFPRIAIWENVPGAFSSNGGEDFRCVLEELARIENPEVSIPKPKKWMPCGCIELLHGSITWRTHDAQYWGVPQRRKRISLIVDFRDEPQPEIQLVSESVSRDSAESREEGESSPHYFERCVDKTRQAISFQERGGKPGGGKGILIQDDHVGTLSTLKNQSVCYGISSYASNAMKSPNPDSGIYKTETSRTLDNNGGNPACNQGGVMIVEGVDVYNHTTTGDVTMSVTGAATDSHHIPCVIEGNPNRVVYSLGHDIRSARFTDDEITDPLIATDYKDPIKINDFKTYQDVTGTLDCGITKGTGNQLANQDMFVANQSVVRRLTPLECERLQGFPDGWTDIGEWTDSKGKLHKEADSPRYKALGNSIAVPYWEWLAKKVVKDLGDSDLTMGSLFDGIGGFPLVFSRAGAKPIWASEIEEFPIAVTKRRFPDVEEK